MDKHTKRYMYDYFGYLGESPSASEIMKFIDKAEDEEAFSYLSSALEDVDDGIYKDAAYLKLLYKVGGIER